MCKLWPFTNRRPCTLQQTVYCALCDLSIVPCLHFMMISSLFFLLSLSSPLSMMPWEFLVDQVLSVKPTQAVIGNGFISLCVMLVAVFSVGWQLYHVHWRGDHLSGKPGNVRELYRCQGNVRNLTKSHGNVRELSGKKSCQGKLPKNFHNCINSWLL